MNFALCMNIMELHENKTMMQNLDIYHSMLDAVPACSVSVPAVLQAMFEQVSHTIEQEKKEAIASSTPNEPDDVAPTLQTYIQQAWNGLSTPTTETSTCAEGSVDTVNFLIYLSSFFML